MKLESCRVIDLLSDLRFTKPFSPFYCSLLRLTQAYSSQDWREIRTLAGVRWRGDTVTSVKSVLQSSTDSLVR